MEPSGRYTHHELIQAMSALNTHDERKPYIGKFITDEIAKVKQAYMFLYNSYDLSKKQRIEYCYLAINKLREDELNTIHPMVQHAIEHILSAIEVDQTPPEEWYKLRCKHCAFLFEADQGEKSNWYCDSNMHPIQCKDIKNCREMLQ